MAGASCAVFGFGGHSWLRKHSWKPVCWRRESLISSCRVSRTFKCIQCHSLPASSQDNMVHPEASSFTTRLEELKENFGYHFEEETNEVLDRCHGIRYDEDALFITAVRFRLLIQGGYSVTTDVFHKFMDNNGNFKEPLGKDIMGLLSLHEATFLGAKDEEVPSRAM